MPIITNQKIKDLAQQMIAKDFLNISDDLVVVMDSFGRIVMVNEKTCRVFGYQEKDLVGKSWFSFISAEEIKIIKPHFAKLFQGKVKIKQHYESLMSAKNGEQKNACWINHLLRDEHKQLVGILSFGQDVTEYKKLITQKVISEEKIKNSEYLYHSLVDTIRLGVEIIDLSGTILFQNKFLENKLGKEVVGKKCWLVYRDDQKKCPGCPLQKLIKLGQKGTLESIGCLKGRVLLIDYTVINYKDKLALLKIIQDITERKESEERLKNSEEKFKIVAEQMPDALFIFDLEDKKVPFRIIDVNKTACKMHGYSREELIGKSISLLDDVNSAKQIPQRKADLLKGKNLNFEVRHQRKNKTTFPVEVHMRQVEFHGKKIAIAIDHDISDRKKVETETVNYNKELERLNDLLVGRELKMIELKDKIKRLEKLV